MKIVYGGTDALPSKAKSEHASTATPCCGKNEGMLSYLRRGRHPNKKTCQLAPIMVRSHCDRRWQYACLNWLAGMTHEDGLWQNKHTTQQS